MHYGFKKYPMEEKYKIKIYTLKCNSKKKAKTTILEKTFQDYTTYFYDELSLLNLKPKNIDELTNGMQKYYDKEQDCSMWKTKIEVIK